MDSASNTSDDEKLARELQAALDLEAHHAEQQQKRAKRKNKKKDKEYLEQNGICSLEQMRGTVDHMLYVMCEVDGRVVELLIDSGASSSAVSSVMVERLGLQHKMSTQIAGNAAGVGSANILGALENVECTMGQVEFRLFFMVLEANVPFMILGLDQMRRFRCVIDLDENILRFGGKDGVFVPFLTKELASQAAMTSFMVQQQAQEQQQQQQHQQLQAQQNEQPGLQSWASYPQTPVVSGTYVAPNNTSIGRDPNFKPSRVFGNLFGKKK